MGNRRVGRRGGVGTKGKGRQEERRGGKGGDLESVGSYRATACNATHGIAVGILSVCPSDACIVTRLNNALRTF